MGTATTIEEERTGARFESKAAGSNSESCPPARRRQKRVAMKVYLLVYDEDIDEASLLRLIDSRKEISDWMTILPASVLLAARHSPRQLAKLLSKKYPDAQFIITEVDTTQTDGMLPEESPRLSSVRFSDERRRENISDRARDQPASGRGEEGEARKARLRNDAARLPARLESFGTDEHAAFRCESGFSPRIRPQGEGQLVSSPTTRRRRVARPACVLTRAKPIALCGASIFILERARRIYSTGFQLFNRGDGEAREAPLSGQSAHAQAFVRVLSSEQGTGHPVDSRLSRT